MQGLVFKKTLTLRKNLPLPSDSNEARIRVLLAGICSTDLEIAKGYMGFQGVLGHEFVGVVEAAPDPSWIGKRVVGEINAACGECCFCLRNMRNHCAQRSVLGILGRDGSFAEYLTLPIQNLHVVPESLADEAAVFTEPIGAAFRIAEQLSIGRDARITLLGDGKLGLLIAQVLKERCRLTVIGRHAERKELLGRWGIQSLSIDQTAPLHHLSDIVIDATGSPKGFELAQQLVRPQGTIVLKTTCAGRPKVDLAKVVIDEVTIIGSRCGPFAPALEILAQKKIDIDPLITEVFPLKKGKQAFRRAAERGVLKVLLRP